MIWQIGNFNELWRKTFGVKCFEIWKARIFLHLLSNHGLAANDYPNREDMGYHHITFRLQIGISVVRML